MVKRIRLFCFPYAAGSATIFYQWKKYLAPHIELVPLEYPGRGIRMNDPWYESRAEAVSDLRKKILSSLAGHQFAFFGHSLGGLFAFYVARELRRVDNLSPQHLFFSGKSSPDVIVKRDRKFHLMPEEEFREEILKLGGTPPEVFNDPELNNFFLPLLRNDFMISETSEWNDDPDPFDCDISVLMGKEDDFVPQQITGWKNHTNRLCTIQYFNGGHFYLHQELPAIVDLINRTLSPVQGKSHQRSPGILTSDNHSNIKL